MKKKLLSLLLMTTMLLAFFAGCGTAETNGSTALPNTPASSDQDNTSEKRIIKILGPQGSNPYIKFADRENYTVWPELKALFDTYHLHPEFEVIPLDQYKTVLQTRTASGTDLPDFLNITYLDDATIIRMANQGLFLPVDELIDQYSDGTAKDFFTNGKGQYSNMLNTTESGKVYWISQIQQTSYDDKPGSTSMLINIRKDWLEAAGLDAPTTADEFYQMLKTFQEKDMNGNGLKDEVLTFNPAVWNNGIAQWFGLVADLSSFVLEDGTVTSPWYQDGIKDYFRFLKKLADEDLLDTTLIGLETDDQLDQKVAENKSAALHSYTMQTWYEASVSDTNAQYMPIAALKAVDTIEPLIAVEPPSLSYDRWAFTKEFQDKEAAAALIDVLCTEKYVELTQWGTEGDTFEVVDGEKQLLPIATNVQWEQAGKEGKALGDLLWANGSIFPKRRFVPMENEIGIVPACKAEVQVEIINYSPTTPIGTSNYYPVMTQEAVDRRNEIFTDLNTRSRELIAQLILGQIEIDDMDQHVAELDALGLKDIVEIGQSSLNRNDTYAK